MRKTLAIGTALTALLGSFVFAQVATAPAQGGAPPSLKQLGVIIYPAKKQTPEQQATDEAECVKWAEAQTGVKLTGGKVDTETASAAAKQQTADATQGAAVAGAAKGAVAGVAIGAVAGDAGQGAAIGAVAGAMAGRRAKKQAEAQAAQQGAKQAQAQNDALVNQFKKAAGTCLSGRGYTVS